jgi:syntaxin-binding protein 1
LLDDESIGPPDKLRLICLYLLYRDGLLQGDISKLLAHSQLPPQDGEVLENLDFLGARVKKPLRDQKPPQQPLFPPKQAPPMGQEEIAISRYAPALKTMLEMHVKGTLDQHVFAYTKPHIDAPPEGVPGVDLSGQASLRGAKPTWARSKLNSVEPKQRILVFVAGGATFAEARACYEVSRASSRDVFLMTTHMQSPALFLRQVGDLTIERRQLRLPADGPKQQAPQHLFEPEPLPKPLPTVSGPVKPPTASMAAMSMNANPRPSNGAPQSLSQPSKEQKKPESKKKDKEKDGEKKKKHFFSSRH